ncbi:hypothetical protein GQX74_006846 [Glossina fuscipes]|nr:hypothetical protein GQX74_006846 [Glossina fuscipes]
MDWTCIQVYQPASLPMRVVCCCYLSTLTAVVGAIALQSVTGWIHDRLEWFPKQSEFEIKLAFVLEGKEKYIINYISLQFELHDMRIWAAPLTTNERLFAGKVLE